MGYILNILNLLGLAPIYLTELLHGKANTRTLLKHSYSNNILIVNVLFIFSDFVKHLFLYCTAPQNRVTWFWCFINMHYYLLWAAKILN